MHSTSQIINQIKTGEKVTVQTEVQRPHEVIKNYLKIKNLTKTDLLHMISIEDINYYKYLSGAREMKRDLFIVCLLSLQVEADDCNQHLKHCAYSQLYVKHKRDQIIYRAFVEKKSLREVNVQLAQNKLRKLI